MPLEQRGVHGSLESIYRQQRRDLRAIDGDAPLTLTGEDRNRRVGADERVVRQQLTHLRLAVVHIIGVADQDVPVPSLFSRAVDQATQARAES